MSYTPVPGSNTKIISGGTAVIVVPKSPNGGIITNPLLAIDQGLTTAEPLYICPTGASAGLTAIGATFALKPGDSWEIIPGQNTTTTANAASTGHRFSAVYY